MTLTNHFNNAGNTEKFWLTWHGHVIGQFSTNGRQDWEAADPVFDKIFVKDDKSSVPMFLANLRPEGWLKQHLGFDRQSQYIKSGMRFLSNLVIYHSDDKFKPFEADEILQRLSDFRGADGVFTGKSELPRGQATEPEFDKLVEKYWDSKHMPRYSGGEMKLPVTLFPDGTIQVARDTQFSHMAKYPSRDGYEALGVNEYLGMSMARAAGLETPEFALVPQGNGLPPVYLIERYDIHHVDNPNKNKDWLITQDFCTLMGKPATDEGKTSGSVEQVGKAIKTLCKDLPSEKITQNLDGLFKRAVMAWVANDCDMHLKNMSLLFAFNPDTREITDIRYSPNYDITTDVMSGNKGGLIDLPVNAKRNKLQLKDFEVLAKNFGLYKNERGQTDPERVREVVHGIASAAARTAVDFVNNPPLDLKKEKWFYDIEVQTSNVVDRARALGADTPEWDSEKVWKSFKQEGAAARQDRAISTAASSYYDMGRRLHEFKFGQQRVV